MASPEYLRVSEWLLIANDFLATGRIILALARIAQAAGAQVIGTGAPIEKTFEGGRQSLSKLNVQVESLATIVGMDDGRSSLAGR